MLPENSKASSDIQSCRVEWLFDLVYVYFKVGLNAVLSIVIFVGPQTESITAVFRS